MYISIIVPTIKTEKEIADLISEIKKTKSNKSELIVVSSPKSAAKNQNIGLDKAKGEFIIICGDDIEQFPAGWDDDLIEGLKKTGASMVGPRLLNPDGSLQAVKYRNYDLSKEFVQVRTMITACSAFRNTHLRFDENYMGSGWEDTDFCMQLGGTFFVINSVKLHHRNEGKNKLLFKGRNRAYFKSKWK